MPKQTTGPPPKKKTGFFQAAKNPEGKQKAEVTILKWPQPQTHGVAQASILKSLEAEISKVKLQIPLLDLLKHQTFKDPIMKILQPDHNPDASDVISL